MTYVFTNLDMICAVIIMFVCGALVGVKIGYSAGYDVGFVDGMES